jgi:hypothetical protein
LQDRQEFQARLARQSPLQKHHVRVSALDLSKEFLAIGRLSHHFKAVRLLQ